MSDITNGLSSSQAKENLKKYGYNELDSDKNRSTLLLLIKVLSEPMFLLLLVSASIYFFLGEKQEAAALFVSIFFVIGITFYQENKTEKTLDKLKSLSSPRALALRDGVLTRIPGREVVPQDVLELTEGDRIPADSIILKSSNLFVDESLLTGESASIVKETGSNLYSGSLIVKGDATVKVLETGMKTQIGKIGKSIKVIEFKDSLLKKETNSVVKGMALIGLSVCAGIFLIEFLRYKDAIKGVLSGITLAMSMIPEEFPVILTIFLSFGAWKLSKKNVLTRRMDVIETLGAITTLCVDKTGTLTKNKMQIQSFYTLENKAKINDLANNIPESVKNLFSVAYYASKETPIDPMEVEIKDVFNKFVNEKANNTGEVIKEYAMTGKIMAITKVRKTSEGPIIASTKGAPESVLDLCQVNKEEREQIMNEVKIMAGEGFRILGVAIADVTSNVTLPENQTDIKFNFIGLLGFEDPVKEGVDTSIKECYDAGIKIIMLTGDYADTALHIAKEINLKNNGKVITGSELEFLTEVELIREISDGVTIFARVQPLQKLKLVNALISKGEIVGMTGDGVNDSPALKEAHVGIAMGKRGTDIAREASGMVLLDDDFNSIVKGIRQGRVIYANIKKAMRYVLSIHVPIAGMALLPPIFGLPTFLYPVHVLFLEFLIDPIATIVFENEKPSSDIMKRNPRPLKSKIFELRYLVLCIFEGLAVLGAAYFMYSSSLQHGSEIYARTMGFITMIAGNLSLVLINRSEHLLIIQSAVRLNKALVFVYSIAFLLLGTLMYTTYFSNLFSFAPLQIKDIAYSVTLGFLSVAILDFQKLFNKK